MATLPYQQWLGRTFNDDQIKIVELCIGYQPNARAAAALDQRIHCIGMAHHQYLFARMLFQNGINNLPTVGIKSGGDTQMIGQGFCS